MISNVVKSLLVVVLMLVTADGCGKYDVPAGSDQGDSAGDNQPNMCAVPPDKGKVQRVGYANDYSYELWVFLENFDCQTVNGTVDATIYREGTYQRPGEKVQYVTWTGDGVGNMQPTGLPWTAEGKVPKVRHTIGLSAVVQISKNVAEDLDLAWLVCSIERDGRLTLEQAGTQSRVPITGAGQYEISCAGDWPLG